MVLNPEVEELELSPLLLSGLPGLGDLVKTLVEEVNLLGSLDHRIGEGHFRLIKLEGPPLEHVHEVVSAYLRAEELGMLQVGVEEGFGLSEFLVVSEFF